MEMTSKDKLIEFLKSANIWYLEWDDYETKIVHSTFNDFCFDLLGEYNG